MRLHFFYSAVIVKSKLDYCLVLFIKPYLIKRPSLGKIWTSNMALKQWHKMDEIVRSNIKMY